MSQVRLNEIVEPSSCDVDELNRIIFNNGDMFSADFLDRWSMAYTRFKITREKILFVPGDVLNNKDEIR